MRRAARIIDDLVPALLLAALVIVHVVMIAVAGRLKHEQPQDRLPTREVAR